MGKFSGILLCSDYDGTFAGRGGAPEKEDCEAVRYFQKEGGLFTVVSGRTQAFLNDFRSYFVPNAPLITLNGGAICSEKNVLDVRTLDKNVLDVIDFGYSLGSIDEAHLWHGCFERCEYGGAFRPSQIFKSLPGPYYKAVLVYKTEKQAEFARDLLRQIYAGQYLFERSWPVGLEIMPYTSGKGNAVNRLRRILGSDIKTIIAVGDYENDISMLKAADIGYAVKNALDNVKQAADRITVANSDNAISAIINEI